MICSFICLGNSALHFCARHFNCCERLLAFIWQPLWDLKWEPLGQWNYRDICNSLCLPGTVMSIDLAGLFLKDLWICWVLVGELDFSLEIKRKAFSVCFGKGLSLMLSAEISRWRQWIKGFPPPLPLPVPYRNGIRYSWLGGLASGSNGEWTSEDGRIHAFQRREASLWVSHLLFFQVWNWKLLVL